MNDARKNRVFKVINKPKRIWGVPTAHFQLALMGGLMFFLFFSSLVAALLLFVAVLFTSRMVTSNDEHLLAIWLNSASYANLHDPAKFDHRRNGR